ncbi:MAG: hypothetical protein LBN37_08215, partial [Bacteroidales bacterium]|nr:hypothetical protein [Bacteroidales bacterium]
MNIQMIFGKPCNDYAAVLQHFAGTKTSSNKTSSLPLAQFWKDAATRLTALETALQMPLQNAVLCFEYPTAPAQGRGKASMTDLMILSGNRQVSIEAKYTEYSKMRTKTVSDWLNKSDTDNRQKVLAGWWNMIAPFRHNTETPDEIGYQFLHRTASACNGATQAAVIYLLFYDNDTQPFLNRYKPL